jgi:hypothetical protein
MRETQQQDNGPGQPVHKKSWIDVKLDTWGPRARNLTHIIGLFAALGLPALLYAYGGPWFEAARQRVFPPPPGGQAQPIPPTSPAPAPKGKGVTTGALPDPYLRPQPANDCIQEGSHVELLDALWQQSERSDQSALRIEGGKLCRPWHAVVHGYERRGAGVRYTLRASTSQWGSSSPTCRRAPTFCRSTRPSRSRAWFKGTSRRASYCCGATSGSRMRACNVGDGLGIQPELLEIARTCFRGLGAATP